MVLIKHPTKKDPENWNKSSILDNQNLKNVFLWNRLGFKKYVIYITNATDTIIDTIYPVIDTRINSTISDIVGDNSNVQIKIDLIPQNASTSIENLLSFILSNPGFKKLKHHDAFNYIKDEVLFGIVRRSVNRGEGTQLSVAESDKIHLLREYMKFGVELDKLVLGCNNYIHFNISIIGHNHLLSIATTVSLSQLSDRIKTLNKKVKKNTINNLHLLEISTLKWLRQIIRFNECITIHDSHTSSSNNYQQSLLFSNLGHYLLNRKFLGEFYKFKSSRVISNQYHELKQFSYRGNCVEDISIDHSGITVIIKCSVSRYGSFHKIHFSKKGWVILVVILF